MIKKVFLVFMVFVMLSISIPVSAETIINDSTYIDSDVTLSMIDYWELKAESWPIMTIIEPAMSVYGMAADVHIKGQTSANQLIIFDPLSNQGYNITLDSEGRFDQIVNLKIAHLSPGTTQIDALAVVEARKGADVVSAKVGIGTVTIPDIDQDGDDVIDSTDYLLFKRHLSEMIGIPQGEDDIYLSLYKELFVENVVASSVSVDFEAQAHIKGQTYADRLVLVIDGVDVPKEYEIKLDEYGRFDQIIDIEGFISKDPSNYDFMVNVVVKAFRGEKEVKISQQKKLENRFKKLLVGDINDDGLINSTDYIYLKRYVLGKIDRFPVETGFYCADVNDDKVFNSTDCVYLKKYLLGIIDSFPKKAPSHMNQ
ncbi:MAG: dockerin type I repeat-containing protein [Bacillota bacterium]